MTVNEVSKLTGVSIRTLQYYDKIGLLHPAKYTESGYRLYDDTALEKLQQILLFRELEFPLKEIKAIINNLNFDRSKAQEEQTISTQMMSIFTEFGTMLELAPDMEKVQAQVKKLQDFITRNFYNCSDEILYSLGNMYAGGGDFTENIDKTGGKGTAEFVFQAIKIYCKK